MLENLPIDLQRLIFQFDPTYRIVHNLNLAIIKNNWGIISLPYIGKPRASLIRWGLTKDRAEILAVEFSSHNHYSRIPNWSYIATYYDMNDTPLVLNCRYKVV